MFSEGFRIPRRIKGWNGSNKLRAAKKKENKYENNESNPPLSRDGHLVRLC